MPSSDKSVILIEFNELSNPLLHRFMDQGVLPNFLQFFSESEVFTTDAEESGLTLNPWVQWVTVHSGVSFREHKAFQLDEGQNVTQPAIWDLLSDAGLRVWVCGSMNPWRKTDLNGFLLPDPWSTGMTPYPAGEFESYYSFIRHHVQEHTNDRAELSKGAALRFMKYMLTHGLSSSTIKMILKQLNAERKNDCKWKRAMVMDRLQWHVFQAYYRRFRPHFSTFFLNSTAHFQHMYWRHMDPEPFSVKPPENELRKYETAIQQGYVAMDDLLGRFIRLAGESTTLIFSAALSQQPYLKHETEGGRHNYRLRDPDVFLELFQLHGRCRYEPVMTEQFWLHFDNDGDRETMKRRLNSLSVDGTKAFNVVHREDGLFCGCRVRQILPPGSKLLEDGEPIADFDDHLYLIEGIKSAMHHPAAPLWIRWPDHKHVVHSDHVSLRAVAPTILHDFGIVAPKYMQLPLATPQSLPA